MTGLVSAFFFFFPFISILLFVKRFMPIVFLTLSCFPMKSNVWYLALANLLSRTTSFYFYCFIIGIYDTSIWSFGNFITTLKKKMRLLHAFFFQIYLHEMIYDVFSLLISNHISISRLKKMLQLKKIVELLRE